MLTDRLHVPALPLVAKLLRGLFLVLMNVEVAVPLLPEAQNCFQNPVAVGQALTRYLQAKFPQCSQQAVSEFVLQLESAKEKSDQDFRVLCRDFLIRLKVATGRRAQA